MESIGRRGFIKKSAVATAGMVMGAPAIMKSWAQKSPNETINIAVVGINGRGKSHYRSWAVMKNVSVIALCDIDERLFPAGVAEVVKLGGKKPRTVVDFRDLLDDKDVDAVSIATPDHWHAIQTIWACQAGKDVYVEKPISYTIDEGRKAVQAARKYNRVVQAGTQSRSNPTVRAAIQHLHNDGLGEIYMTKGLCYKPRASIGHKKNSPIPKGVNWDLFLGPAPYRPFNENRFHYNWHWFWDTGTTDMGNQGVHEMDIARWALNKREHPVKIHGFGNYFVWDSDQETPNVQHVTFEYEDGKVLQFEVRGLFTNGEADVKIGNIFYGSKGWMSTTGDYQTYLTEITLRPDGFSEYKETKGPNFAVKSPTDKPADLLGGELGEHGINFINCMRSRKWQELNGEILEGHMSTSLCHLGNIACRTQRTLYFNPYSEKFVNDEDANSFLKREYRYPYAVPDEV